ncbi:hypothetical protein GCM10011346_04610 [Oceanobacillus neutriphilus]|uniref:Uncharacterized protein n=1 Tax=Oceanobacillus neutriphilus TaxID=531815 RepID=A0ABQ2NPJ5_9BACI|nr:hypothetical protein GCM10011346_04610 [Oceanobacillus neutriphilus]
MLFTNVFGGTSNRSPRTWTFLVEDPLVHRIIFIGLFEHPPKDQEFYVCKNTPFYLHDVNE